MRWINPGVGAAVLLLTLLPTVTRSAVLHVDPSAPGVSDGSSWEDAFVDLPSALATAVAGDSVLVAGGLYVPGSDRSDTFALPGGAAVLGSYGGYASAEPYGRDVDGNPSTLSGEIGDPGPEDNCLHVVDASGTVPGTILDGFVVTRGYASGTGADVDGGGVYADPCALTMRRVLLVDNVSIRSGAGFYCTDGSVTLEDVEVRDGRAGAWGNGHGGGGYTALCDVTLTDCAFLDNTAEVGGGGLFYHGGTLIATRCVFEWNTASFGGGLRINAGESTLLDCEFRYNASEEDGGGVWAGTGVTPLRIVNGLFWRNYTMQPGSNSSVGGGLYLGGFGTTMDQAITSCTFAENEAGVGGAIYIFHTSPVRVTDSILWGNYGEWAIPEINSRATLSHCLVAGSGGSGAGWDPEFGIDGGGNLDADPEFEFMVLGNLHVGPGSPAIDAGDPSAPDLADHDLDGNPRILGVTVDIGAYEFVGPVSAKTSIAKASAPLRVGPSPSRGDVNVSLLLPRASDVTLRVYDVQGRLVRRLASGWMETGVHRVAWNGRGFDGPMPAGVYFVQLQAGDVSASRRVVILR